MTSYAVDSPPSRRSVWRAVVGVLWVVVAGACAYLSRGSLLASHPAYAVTIGVVLVVGLHFLLTGLGRRRSPRRHRVLTVLGRAVAVPATLVLLGGLAYLVPYSASGVAKAAMSGSSSVRIKDSATRITLTPRSGTPKAGLVFQPGAKVDPRAYVPLLEQVAAAGSMVVIVKQPYDIGFAAIGAPSGVIHDHPEVTAWAVGGHSLGGVAAAEYADSGTPRVRGLVLWGSYPLDSLAARTDLVAASVSGTKDGLSTPEDIEASRAKLPASTTFTAVQGGVHAYFGDYGVQPGDGSPTVARATAQAQIVQATVDLLRRVSAAP